LSLVHVIVQYPHGPRALDRVSLDVPPGIFGLLGPNGAGKSTLLRVCATLQRPDAGTIRFADRDAPDGLDLGRDAAAVRRRLGYLPQDFGLWPTLSVAATLDHFCALKGATDRDGRAALVEALLRRTNLLDKRRAAVASLSGGMRQRLGLAIALAGAPTLLLLDEPTAGLDPGERRRMYDLLGDVAADAVVVLSTHLVDDVRAVCGRFALLHRGRIAAEGAPREALAALRAERRAAAATDAERAAADELTLEDLYFAHVPPGDTA
jgi:ABC-type multidrug transport system ATPase subunit